MKDTKVMVGMSGGVDSSAAAAILCEMGYSVAGVTLILCDEDNSKNIEDAASVCEKLGIPHFVYDLTNEFKQKVVDNFIDEYKKGNTPNPCIVCNKEIKFGAMIDFALKNGYHKIATGHYARLEDCDGRYLIKTAKDLTKDQSYVLYGLTQQQLKYTLLPLGDYSKNEIRQIALNKDLINANRPDSQDICFVPDGDYAAFIEKSDSFTSLSGDYVDINGNFLGKHKGIINYTIGQRKGLGIALGKPAFVIDKNAETNRVILGDEEYLFKKQVEVADVNLIIFDNLIDSMEVTAKLRYRHNAAKATAKMLDNGNILLTFEEPQRAPSPGQAAVIYDGEYVVGGGTII